MQEGVVLLQVHAYSPRACAAPLYHVTLDQDWCSILWQCAQLDNDTHSSATTLSRPMCDPIPLQRSLQIHPLNQIRISSKDIIRANRPRRCPVGTRHRVCPICFSGLIYWCLTMYDGQMHISLHLVRQDLPQHLHLVSRQRFGGQCDRVQRGRMGAGLSYSHAGRCEYGQISPTCRIPSFLFTLFSDRNLTLC